MLLLGKKTTPASMLGRLRGRKIYRVLMVAKQTQATLSLFGAIDIWELYVIDTWTSRQWTFFSHFEADLSELDISEGTVKLNPSCESSHYTGMGLSAWTRRVASCILFLPSCPFLRISSGLYSSPFCVWCKQVFYSLSLMMWRKTEGCEESSNALSSEIIDTKIAHLAPFSLPTSISGKGERT